MYAMFASKRTAWGLLAAAAIALSIWLPPLLCKKTADPVPNIPSGQIENEGSDASVPLLTLFPGLNPSHITSLCVSTPERSFQFQQNGHGAVSVNGQQADSDIFSVLLNQIAGLPVEQHSAFAPQAQDLLLTLVVTTGTHQKTARFYEGSGKGKTARIVLDTAESPEYRQTTTWRVGTLMMACEGTRILDAHGNEQPAAAPTSE